MIIIWGIRSMRRSMGVVLAMCHNCSRPCAQSIFVIRRWFTLFFIPLFPVGTKYVGVCSLCASATRMDREPAERLEQEGNRQRQQPVEYRFGLCHPGAPAIERTGTPNRWTPRTVLWVVRVVCWPRRRVLRGVWHASGVDVFGHFLTSRSTSHLLLSRIPQAQADGTLIA
jgi:hypothetical protein